MEAMPMQPSGGMGDPSQVAIQPNPPEKIPAEVDIPLQEDTNILYLAGPKSPPLVIFADEQQVLIVDTENSEKYNWTYASALAPITVGRSKTNDIQMLKPTISGNHAEITKKGSKWNIKDVKSTNGIYRETNPVGNGLVPEGRVPFGGWTVFDLQHNDVKLTINGQEMQVMNDNFDEWYLMDTATYQTRLQIQNTQFLDIDGNQFILVGNKLLVHDTGKHVPGEELIYQQAQRTPPHDRGQFPKISPAIRRFSSAPDARYRITGVTANSDEHLTKGEDWGEADAQKGIVVIADGAGGHKHGEIASHIAATTIRYDLSNFLEDKPRPTEDQLKTFFETSFGNAKKAMVTKADEDKAVNSKSRLDDMTTAVSAAVVTFDYAAVATTGDTRFYATVKTIDGRTETVLLTRDHNVVYGKLQAGEITEETAREIEKRLDNATNENELEDPPIYDTQGRKVHVMEYWERINVISKSITASPQDKDTSMYEPEVFFYPRRGKIVGIDGKELNGEIISITGTTDGIEGVARKELDSFLTGEKPLPALIHDVQVQDGFRAKPYDDDKCIIHMNVSPLPVRSSR